MKRTHAKRKKMRKERESLPKRRRVRKEIVSIGANSTRAPSLARAHLVHTRATGVPGTCVGTAEAADIACGTQ